MRGVHPLKKQVPASQFLRRRAFIYAFSIPRKTDTGFQLRLISNCRVFLDLNYEVELVHIFEDPYAPIAAGHKGSERIRDLCARYPQVSLLVRVPNLGDLYSSCDAQIVASTEATGLRTRIVESFAFGVPVISSTTAAKGVTGIVGGENIFLADSIETWVQTFESLLQNPGLLQSVSQNARRTYDEIHSPPAVAESLKLALSKHLNEVH